MKQVFMIIACSIGAIACYSQQADKHVITGNKLYHQKKYDQALDSYNKSIEQNPKDAVVNFNTGDVNYRTAKFEDAVKSFENTIGNTADSDLKQKGFYNKGVSLSRQNKLEESIDAYKNAVKMNPADSDARVNLQKALLELKKKTPPPLEKKEDKKKKQQQEQKPQQRESKMTKKEVEQRLKALQEREQQVQRKMQQRNRSAGQQEKDW